MTSLLGASPSITKNFIKMNSKNDLYNLNKWKKFEEDNPTTFSGMYQFWCQKDF